MKRKFNKKLLMFGLPILMIGLIFAGTVYFFSVSTTGTINEALSTLTTDLDFTAYPGEEVTDFIEVDNIASADLYVGLDWIEKSNIILMDKSEGTCDNYPDEGWRDECEMRIELNVDNMLLSEFKSISWDAKVLSGYAPHVDLILSNGKSLTFEYATIDADCNAPSTYPTGEIDTFDNMGIVNDDAYAWESLPGPCGDSTFEAQHNTLAEWKSQYFLDAVTIDRIEIEVDNWMKSIPGHRYNGIGASSHLGNIRIDGIRLDGQLYGVTYSVDESTQVASADATTDIAVQVTYNEDSPIGEIKGTVILSRVPNPN